MLGEWLQNCDDPTDTFFTQRASAISPCAEYVDSGTGLLQDQAPERGRCCSHIAASTLRDAFVESKTAWTALELAEVVNIA